MSIYYLIDATVLREEQRIQLTFFDPSNNKWKEIVDSNYRPYFFIPYPIPKDDFEVMKDLKFDMQVLEKVDLFSGEPVKLAKIELSDFSGFLQISRKFSQTWESEVSIISSYMYDKGLVFGAQYKIKDEKIVPVVDVSKEDLEVFRQIQKNMLL